MSAIFYKNLPYGAGGSNVEANPSGSATGDLTKVGIDGTVYDVTDADAVHNADKGVANGVASLDATGRVPSTQLPSYVDDVLEYASQSAFPATGESGKIYIALDTNKTYRWSGSAYVEISESLALGETTGTAYEGSKGKANADNIASLQTSVGKAYKTDDSAETDLQDTDYIPFYDTSATAKKKSLWSNIKAKLKAYFDTLYDKTPTLATVATSGSYNDLTNKPTIPSGQIQSDWNQTDSAQVDFIKNKPDIDLEGSKTATGNPITLTDASESYAEELEVTLEPIQSGSGTPSPSNIRPITGYTDVNVGSVGKNLFDKDNMDIVSGKYLNGSGVEQSLGNANYSKTFIPVQPNTAYTWTGNKMGGTSINAAIYGYNANKEFVQRTGLVNTDQFTTNADVVFIQLQFGGTSPYTTNDFSSWQIEKGTQATAYEPYHSNTTHTPLGRTVYGGKLNVTGGEAESRMDKADLYSFTWSWSSTYNGYYSDSKASGIKETSSTSVVPNILSNQFATYSMSQIVDGGISLLTSGATKGRFFIKTQQYESASAFRESLNGAYVVYELATPQTYQLTPQELKLLKQYNYITTNGTTISLKYQPDNVIGEAIGVSEEYTDRRTKWKVFDGLTNGSTLDLNALRQYDEALFCLFNGSYFPCRVDSIYMPTAYDVALTLSGNIRPYYGGSDVLYGEIDNSGNVTITRGNTADNFSSIIVYVR